MQPIKKNQNIFYCDKIFYIFEFFQYNLCATLGVTNKKIQKFFIKTNFFIFLIFFNLIQWSVIINKRIRQSFQSSIKLCFLSSGRYLYCSRPYWGILFFFLFRKISVSFTRVLMFFVFFFFVQILILFRSFFSNLFYTSLIISYY